MKSFLGLSRQRSETNLSSLGLISTEPRRSRSEVRGVSCDRLTIGYHTTPTKPFENGKTRCSSPPLKSGCWIRGRKRERESRNPIKNNLDSHGKTIVTGSNSKRTSSKTRNGSIDCRTIVDGCDNKQKNKICLTKSTLESRRGKSSKRSGEEDIIEEEVTYSEIEHDNIRGKLLAENKETPKDANKVIRKKGMAPKPQITTAHFKDTNGDVNSSGRKLNGTINSMNNIPQTEVNCKSPRKNQTYSGRNQDRRAEHRTIQSVKLNNLKNAEKALLKDKNSINSQSVVAIAEIHKEIPLNYDKYENKKDREEEPPKNTDINNSEKIFPNNKESIQDSNQTDDERDPPYHIDTPDYSTLESVNGYSVSTDDITYSKDDIVNCNTDCDESVLDSSTLITSDTTKNVRETSLSSILRDSSNENRGGDSEPKKTVRFEKLDLIEKYKKNKSETLMDTEDDADVSIFETKSLVQNHLDVNSNEVVTSDTQSLLEDFSQCSEKHANDSAAQTNCQKGMTVNVLVRNPSPTPQDNQNEESPTQFVVKKSFVITVAKQEMGFKSLCANKKPEVTPENNKTDQQISVTFLCSGPPSEGWVLPSQDNSLRLRSTSVPPRSLQPTTEVMTAVPAMRGRSRERRSKERHHCRKSHKAKKKGKILNYHYITYGILSTNLQ